MEKLDFVKVIKIKNKLRVIKCDKKGKRIGSYFVTFPKKLRKENRILRKSRQ